MPVPSAQPLLRPLPEPDALTSALSAIAAFLSHADVAMQSIPACPGLITSTLALLPHCPAPALAVLQSATAVRPGSGAPFGFEECLATPAVHDGLAAALARSGSGADVLTDAARCVRNAARWPAQRRALCRCVRPLVAALAHAAGAVREAAAEALINLACHQPNRADIFAAGAVPALMQCAGDAAGSVGSREAAASCLGCLSSFNEDGQRQLAAAGAGTALVQSLRQVCTAGLLHGSADHHTNCTMRRQALCRGKP